MKNFLFEVFRPEHARGRTGDEGPGKESLAENLQAAAEVRKNPGLAGRQTLQSPAGYFLRRLHLPFVIFSASGDLVKF
jgi:hypothetical protein